MSAAVKSEMTPGPYPMILGRLDRIVELLEGIAERGLGKELSTVVVQDVRVLPQEGGEVSERIRGHLKNEILRALGGNHGSKAGARGVASESIVGDASGAVEASAPASDAPSEVRS